MEIKNQKLLSKMKELNLPYWKLGVILGCHENTVYRMLRTELPEAKQDEIIRLIEEANTSK